MGIQPSCPPLRSRSMHAFLGDAEGRTSGKLPSINVCGKRLRALGTRLLWCCLALFARPAEDQRALVGWTVVASSTPLRFPSTRRGSWNPAAIIRIPSTSPSLITWRRPAAPVCLPFLNTIPLLPLAVCAPNPLPGSLRAKMYRPLLPRHCSSLLRPSSLLHHLPSGQFASSCSPSRQSTIRISVRAFSASSANMSKV